MLARFSSVTVGVTVDLPDLLPITFSTPPFQISPPLSAFLCNFSNYFFRDFTSTYVTAEAPFSAFFGKGTENRNSYKFRLRFGFRHQSFGSHLKFPTELLASIGRKIHHNPTDIFIRGLLCV